MKIYLAILGLLSSAFVETPSSVLWIKHLPLDTLPVKKMPAKGKETATTKATPAKGLRPELTSSSKTDEHDTPHSIIYVKLGKQMIRVDSTIGNLNPMEASERQLYKVPKTAIVASSAFWAGLLSIYCIEPSSKGWLVKRRYIDEGEYEEKGELYKTIKVIPLTK